MQRSTRPKDCRLRIKRHDIGLWSLPFISLKYSKVSEVNCVVLPAEPLRVSQDHDEKELEKLLRLAKTSESKHLSAGRCCI